MTWGRVLTCKSHLGHIGKEAEHLPSGGTVRPPRHTPPNALWLIFKKFWEGMRQLSKGYKGRGYQPLAVCTHHQKTQTTRCAPTTGGSWPPAQRPLLVPRVVRTVLLFIPLLSSLSLSLTFLAHTGNVGRSLSIYYILWFSEIRHCVVATFAKSIRVSNPIAPKVMFKVVIFCNSTAFRVKPLWSLFIAHWLSVLHRDFKSSPSPFPAERDGTPKQSRVAESPLLTCWPCFLWCSPGYNRLSGLRAQTARSSFSSTNTTRSFSSGLLSVHSLPSLYLGLGLPWPLWRTLHLALMKFMRFTQVHLSSLSCSLWMAFLLSNMKTAPAWCCQQTCWGCTLSHCPCHQQRR